MVVTPELEARQWYAKHPECQELLDTFVEVVTALMHYRIYVKRQWTTCRFPLLREFAALVIIACAKEGDPVPLAVIEHHLAAAAKASKAFKRPHMAVANVMKGLEDIELVKCENSLCVPTERSYMFVSLMERFIQVFNKYAEKNGLWDKVKESWEKLVVKALEE